MDIKTALVEAYKRGRAWDASYPNLANLDEDRISKMNGTEEDAKQLLSSLQRSDINYEALVEAYHKREPEFDGELGPATIDLIKLPRCPIPDFPPPPNASFDYGDPDLNEAVKSYQEYAQIKEELSNNYVGGSGSWPKCDPQFPNVHSVRVNIDTSKASTHQKDNLKAILKLVEACEAEMGQSVRHIIDGNPNEAEHDVRFEYIAGNVIGYAYFPTPNTCNQVVKCRIDNSYNANVITLANLFVHEYKGHSDGLDHTRGGIMNPSIIIIDPLSWKKDPHESTKRRFFGGVAIPTDPTIPTPDPNLAQPALLSEFFGTPNGAGGTSIRGELVLTIPEGCKGTFHYIMEPIDARKYKLVKKAQI